MRAPYLLSDAPGLWCTSSAAEKVALQTFFSLLVWCWNSQRTAKTTHLELT